MTDPKTLAAGHDWRVDPFQVVQVVDGASRLRLVCAHCQASAIIESRPTLNPVQNAPGSWRPFQWRGDDQVISTRGL